MRHKIVLLLMILLLTTSSIAFAQETWQTRLQNKTPAQADGRITLEQKAIRREEAKSMLLPKREEIIRNRKLEYELKMKLKVQVQEVQDQIKSIKKDRSLTPEKLAAIKKELAVVKTSRASLRNTMGRVDQEMIKYKTSLRNRNLAAAETSLNTVISIQQRRIELLQNTLAALETLQKSL